jgi:hypothetical protein
MIREKNAAASLIQLTFRNYRRDNTLWEELEEKDPDLYERISEQEEKLVCSPSPISLFVMLLLTTRSCI